MAPFTDRYLNFYRQQKSPGKTCFLWPVWVWEILAPKPGKTSLNLFQRSILGLLNCNIMDSAQIAQWLGIDGEMVLYIISGQLQPNGWLNTDYTLTDAGKELLDMDVDVRSDMTTAYVFMDALTGQLWPRVAQDLPHIEPVNISSHGMPEFAQDRESGRKDIPYVVPCPLIEPPGLDLEALWDAVQQGNNAIHNQTVRDELDYEHREFHADEVECIESRPFRAYILCWILNDPVQHWTVTDPLAVERFGDFLRPAVFEAAKKHKGFAKKLKDYMGEVREDETLDSWNARIHADAEFDLSFDFPGASRVPHLETYLIALLRRQQRVKENGDKPWFYEDWEDLVSQCQKVFECCFKWMLNEWPLKNPRVIERNWKYDDIYTALESIAGEAASEDALQNLSRQKPNSIYHAANSRDHNASLRPLIAACLFALPGHTNHPVLGLSTAKLLGLETILAVADTRNEVAHASGKKISINGALAYTEFTKNWVGSLLNELK